MTSNKKKTVWFARGGGIVQSGPFVTQVAAVESMRLAPDNRYPGDEQLFPADVFVWPEEIDVEPVLTKPKRIVGRRIT